MNSSFMRSAAQNRGCLAASVVIYVISMLVLALPLAFVAAVTAPVHSPAMIGKIICPPGSRVEVSWYQAADKIGEESAAVECVDASGGRTPAVELDNNSLPAVLRHFYPICLLPLLLGGAVLIGALAVLIRRQRLADPAEPFSKPPPQS